MTTVKANATEQDALSALVYRLWVDAYRGTDALAKYDATHGDYAKAYAEGIGPN